MYSTRNIFEQLIRQSIKQTPAGNYLALPPDTAAHLVQQITTLAGPRSDAIIAVVSSMDVRRYVRRMIEEKIIAEYQKVLADGGAPTAVHDD